MQSTSLRNSGLKEAQGGIKIARRNINNVRYADDNTLMAESEEELKSLLMKVREESGKVGLKLNIQKMKIMASSPITSRERDGETVDTVSDFTFLKFCFIDYAKAFDCVDHNKLDNSERDGNTRLPDLPLEKPICRSGNNS